MITFAGPSKGAGCSALRFKCVPAIVSGWTFGGSCGEVNGMMVCSNGVKIFDGDASTR